MNISTKNHNQPSKMFHFLMLWVHPFAVKYFQLYNWKHIVQR